MKIAIIGYGKMGHMIESIALERGHEIVAIVDEGRMDEWANVPQADVAIEFTTPATAEGNIRKAWQLNIPVVCGSTGWNLAFGNKIAKVHTAPLNEQATCASALPKKRAFSLQSTIISGTPNKRIVTDENGKTMLVWSSNFSVGVNIFFELNKELASRMSVLQSQMGEGSYTPSIKEIHHIHKLDKPSGTAKTLAEQISTMYKGTMYNVQREIPIESIREGEVPGTHEVTWDSEEDTIVITHIAKGRRGFALGAVLAAEEVAKKNKRM